MKITFGKYNGHTLASILESDKSYFEWLMVNSNRKRTREKCGNLYEVYLNENASYIESSVVSGFDFDGSYCRAIKDFKMLATWRYCPIAEYCVKNKIKAVFQIVKKVKIEGGYSRRNTQFNKWVGSTFKVFDTFKFLRWNSDISFQKGGFLGCYKYYYKKDNVLSVKTINGESPSLEKLKRKTKIQNIFLID